MPRRIVLKGTGKHENFTRLAWEEDWDLVDIQHTESPFIEVWTDSATSTDIHYIEDDLVGHSYVVLHGKETNAAEVKIQETCASWKTADALSAFNAATERNNRLTALFAAALSADEVHDSSLMETLHASATTEDDRGVRQAIVVIAGYLQWPALIQLIEHMKEDDPSEQVRTNAEVMLEGIKLNSPPRDQ